MNSVHVWRLGNCVEYGRVSIISFISFSSPSSHRYFWKAQSEDGAKLGIASHKGSYGQSLH